eukprot:GHVN01004606.1.p2 GENE.GHVN01004606.1~~GHVN01004606.1.p2  ORF type:complete len:111 (+),score=15.32 GHVN01004606.1:46-378(+)
MAEPGDAVSDEVSVPADVPPFTEEELDDIIANNPDMVDQIEKKTGSKIADLKERWNNMSWDERFEISDHARELAKFNQRRKEEGCSKELLCAWLTCMKTTHEKRKAKLEG